MDRVKIQNKYIGKVIPLFYDLKLKGVESRHRTKFIRLMQEHLEKVEEDRKQLIDEYARKDENGEYEKDPNNPEMIIINNPNEFASEEKELYNEELIIEGEMNNKTMSVVKNILSSLDIELSGEDAEIYDYLCEKLNLDEDDEK